MAKYKPIDRGPRLLAVSLEDQLEPGSFAFALDRLLDSELDLSAFDAKFAMIMQGRRHITPN